MRLTRYLANLGAGFTLWNPVPLEAPASTIPIAVAWSERPPSVGIRPHLFASSGMALGQSVSANGSRGAPCYWTWRGTASVSLLFGTRERNGELDNAHSITTSVPDPRGLADHW